MKVGDRIRFKHTLDCGPTGDHPAYIYARKDEFGVIIKVGGCREGFWVKWDGWPHAPFGCESKDFEVIGK